MILDESMGDSVKVTVIATGVDRQSEEEFSMTKSATGPSRGSRSRNPNPRPPPRSRNPTPSPNRNPKSPC